jgi:osmotically-inducible protein OsmY
MRKSDAELKHDIEAELEWEPKVNATQIGVTVDRGAVSLFGAVDSFAQKWAAEAAVRRVRGVRSFAEELTVKLSTPHERTDLEVATAVGNVLTCNASVPNTVTVKVEEGWVTLYGDVRHQFQREAALKLVGHVQGVLGVTSEMTLEPAAPPSVTEEGLRGALQRRFGDAAASIQIAVDGTRVTLRGHAPTLRAAREARTIAWSAPGIVDVVDLIETGTDS